MATGKESMSERVSRCSAPTPAPAGIRLRSSCASGSFFGSTSSSKLSSAASMCVGLQGEQGAHSRSPVPLHAAPSRSQGESWHLFLKNLPHERALALM